MEEQFLWRRIEFCEGCDIFINIFVIESADNRIWWRGEKGRRLV